ncbi:MAG TPA: ATP-binding protein [Bacteroidales bacterium]|nr:ATP-binding protein [Bacteroidales bacterium]
MKALSPKRVSLSIAVFTTLFFACILVVVLFLHPKFSLLVEFLGAFGLFTIVYLVTKYFIGNFIFEKIKPIYRTIYSTQISGKELRKNLGNRDIITEVKNEVGDWARHKAEEIDELRQLEKYRREFVGNVSHELKTPIFNIQGYILTLLDGGLEDPAINRLYLERAEKSINRMISIVEDLESISRLESGELKLEMEDFNIVNLVYDVFELQEMLAQKCGVKLTFAANYEKPIRVNADKKRIIEVVNNLVVNAIKYNKRNGVTTVGFYEIGDQIMVEITDTGIGIAEKDISRIFERFYRTDKSRSRDQGGTGLGLSIVKHIIEAHEQTISVRSKYGEGSTFTFSLNKAQGKS